MSRHVSDHLSAYMDGALGVQDIERVRAHLDTCPSCLQEYTGLAEIQRLLRGLPDPTPREGFLERVHWRLAREAAHPGPAARARTSRPRFLRSLRDVVAVRPFRLVLVASAVVVVLGVSLAWMTGQFGTREVPLDTDAYVRHYLVLSTDRPLVDEATITFVSADLGASEQPIR